MIVNGKIPNSYDEHSRWLDVVNGSSNIDIPAYAPCRLTNQSFKHADEGEPVELTVYPFRGKSDISLGSLSMIAINGGSVIKADLGVGRVTSDWPALAAVKGQKADFSTLVYGLVPDIEDLKQGEAAKQLKMGLPTSIGGRGLGFGYGGFGYGGGLYASYGYGYGYGYGANRVALPLLQRVYSENQHADAITWVAKSLVMGSDYEIYYAVQPVTLTGMSDDFSLVKTGDSEGNPEPTGEEPMTIKDGKILFRDKGYYSVSARLTFKFTAPGQSATVPTASVSTGFKDVSDPLGGLNLAGGGWRTDSFSVMIKSVTSVGYDCKFTFEDSYKTILITAMVFVNTDDSEASLSWSSFVAVGGGFELFAGDGTARLMDQFAEVEEQST